MGYKGNGSNDIELLKMLFGEEQLNKTPGRTPTAHVQNYMLANRELSPEQQGEQTTLDQMDARGDASFNADLAQNKLQAGARNEGFDSLKAKEEHYFNRDKQAKIDVAKAGADTALSRMFFGSQLIADRQDANRDRIDAGAEATRNGVASRQAADDIRTDAFRRAQATEMGKLPDQNVHWYNNGLFNMLGLADNEQQIRYRDAEKIRDQARATAPGAPIGPGQPAAPEPAQPSQWKTSTGKTVTVVR